MVHGVIGKKFGLLHKQLDNKLLSKVGVYCQIACFLYNKFVKRIQSDYQILDQIILRMKEGKTVENDLAVEKEEQRWQRRKSLFIAISLGGLTDFPELSKDDFNNLLHRNLPASASGFIPGRDD